MSTSKQRDAGKERFWRTMMRQWRSSGLSVRAFCDEQRLSQANFYAWRRILKQRDGEGVHLVPVRVLTEDNAGDSSAATGLELVLSHGRVLRIGPAFDEATLQRLLRTLAEGQPCC